MVDIENSIFNEAATNLRLEFKNIYVTGEKTNAPSKFPAVSIVEVNNSIYHFTRNLAGQENHSYLMYETEVFSNLTTGKKSECKAIIAYLDSLMQSMGFARIICIPVPNEDASIYRMLARYRAVVSADKKIHKII